MQANVQASMLKQFYRMESKFSCRKHSKESNKFAQKFFIQKKELKTRLLAYVQMNTNRNGSIYFFLILLLLLFIVHIVKARLSTFAFMQCLAGVNTTVGFLIIALTVRISHRDDMFIETAQPMRNHGLRKIEVARRQQ